MQHLRGLSTAATESVSVTGFCDFINARLHELRHGVLNSIKVVDELQTAFGTPGEPGDAEHIVFIAQELGRIYDYSIDWAQRIMAAHVHAELRPALLELAKFVDDVLAQMERIAASGVAAVERAILAPAGSPQKSVVFKLEPTIRNQDKFGAILQEIDQMICAGKISD